MFDRFDPELEAFRAEVREYLTEAMRPDAVAGHADPRDLTGLDVAFERALQMDAGTRGYLAVNYPVEMGGGGRSPAYRAVFATEAAAADAPVIDTALTLGGAPILAHGSAAQRALLPAMARGEVLLCIAYSEPDAGSDLTAVATVARRAVPDDPASDWIVDGTKHLVTGAHKAEWCLIIARTDLDPSVPPRRSMSMFLLPLAETPGVTVERVRTANDWTLGTIRFDGARLPADALLGEEGRGLELMGQWLGATRLAVAASSVGRGRRVLEASLEWAATREQFGQPIGRFQGVSFPLADSAVELEAAELLTLQAADRHDRGVMTDLDVAMAKVFATEALGRITDRAVQVFGGMGLVAESPVERWWRDARVERIWDGTSEIQRHIISRGLLRPLGA